MLVSKLERKPSNFTGRKSASQISKSICIPATVKFLNSHLINKKSIYSAVVRIICTEKAYSSMLVQQQYKYVYQCKFTKIQKLLIPEPFNRLRSPNIIELSTRLMMKKSKLLLRHP